MCAYNWDSIINCIPKYFIDLVKYLIPHINGYLKSLSPTLLQTLHPSATQVSTLVIPLRFEKCCISQLSIPQCLYVIFQNSFPFTACRSFSCTSRLSVASLTEPHTFQWRIWPSVWCISAVSLPVDKYTLGKNQVKLNSLFCSC